MKQTRKWMILLWMLFAPIVMMAQVQFGVKGGVNLSKISFSGSHSNLRSDNRTGFFIGPMADIRIPFFGLGIDVAAQYSQSELACGEADATMKTLEVPLNFKYSAGIGKLLSAYIAAGPQFGFNLGHTWESAFRIEKRTTSMNIGTGLKILGHVQLGINYNIALGRTATFFANTANKEQDIQVKVRNNTWQVSLAYLF